MYSLKQIFNAESQSRIDKARNTSNITTKTITGGGEKYKETKNVKDLDLKEDTSFYFEVRSDSGHIHNTSLNFPNGVGFELPVRCYCSCSDFKYRSAYVLWREGSYHGHPPEGIKDVPEKTNPSLIPYVCKHLVAVVLGLRDSGFLKT